MWILLTNGLRLVWVGLRTMLGIPGMLFTRLGAFLTIPPPIVA